MKLKSRTKFEVRGLNQERVLNSLSSIVVLFNINRKEKTQTSFMCLYKDRKKVEKFLKNSHLEIVSIETEGLACYLDKFLGCYWVWLAGILCVVAFAIQYQFIMAFQVYGLENLPKEEIVEFLKENVPRKKSDIDLKNIENVICQEFKEISFVSCAIRGQTLVLNVKEKLLPSVMEDEFSPIIAKSDAKIAKIDLISGTLCVSVGDFVKKGEVLVQPFVEDASGEIKKVEAKAEIYGEVYNLASVDHYDKKIEVRRTGRKAKLHEVGLFGLKIYAFKEDFDFKMYEVETQETNMAKNLLLPFVLKKTYVYEIEEILVEKSFDEEKTQCIEKAKENALKNCNNCDIIKYEFYTTRQLSGVTIVTYCIVTEENIGGKNVS